MSEVHSASPETSDTTEPATDFGHQPERGREPAQDARSYSDQEGTATARGDYGDLAEQEASLEGDDAGAYDDAGLDAMLTQEEQLPEPRTRQEARAGTWGDTADETDSADLGSEYDGDLDALLTAEEQLPDPRTRQEARAETWGDDAGSRSDEPTADFSNPAAEYDGVLDALLASEEERLPEPRTRQEARAGTWGYTNGQDAGTSLDASTTSGNPLPETPAGQENPGEDARSDTSSSTATASETTDAGAVSLPDHAQGQAADDVPSPDQTVVAVHDQYGHDWPLTVAHLTAEDRTLGDDTLTGIGLKPTGEQLRDMESDKLSRGDRFRRNVYERVDDIQDASEKNAGALEGFLGSHRPTGHDEVYTTQPTIEAPQPPPADAGNIATAGLVLGLLADRAIHQAREWLRRSKG
jgi:hypothetical protein